MRIASLIPSGTDIAFALGLGSQLVGVSHECDHAGAQGLPILTGSVIPFGFSPREVDDCVNEALSQPDANGSLYRTNRELLRELRPDVILTQTICDVCAVNAASVACDLPPNARLIDLSATGFDGLWRDLRYVAKATDSDAEALIAQCQARIETVHRVLENANSTPRVLSLEWTDPPFIGGHWVPEIIARAGGRDVLGQSEKPSRRATWGEIAATDPDLILLLPCGYGLQETAEQGRALLHQIEYSNLLAVRNGAVWATDATRLFSRCTPHSVRAVEVVAGILHPHLFASPTKEEALRIQE